MPQVAQSQEPRAFVHEMFRNSQAAQIDSVYNQLTQAWAAFQPELRRDIPEPTEHTSKAEFLNQVEAKAGIWRDLAAARDLQAQFQLQVTHSAHELALPDMAEDSDGDFGHKLMKGLSGSLIDSMVPVGRNHKMRIRPHSTLRVLPGWRPGMERDRQPGICLGDLFRFLGHRFDRLWLAWGRRPDVESTVDDRVPFALDHPDHRLDCCMASSLSLVVGFDSVAPR
ncbi:hypothetical protein ACJ73_02032 [Blastomyces percursus]|uniref:Uncharacterized protein n=1 Tax=Blastomyces percursus TaxID=1658174 RepID=A0A1J9QDM8_9EURO|nr:hypothetical protein ACJ73_02032 [Blastomyces percursus]